MRLSDQSLKSLLYSFRSAPKIQEISLILKYYQFMILWNENNHILNLIFSNNSLSEESLSEIKLLLKTLIVMNLSYCEINLR